MKIKIVVDSASNMYAMDGIAFESVPLKIVTDIKEYVDDTSLDVEAMVDDLSTYKGRSGTACPGVGDWLAAFEDCDIIYCVTIISTLSGSYNAAMTAKQQYEEENPGKRVYVLDSYSAGPEEKLHALELKRMVQEGKDYDTICREIEAYKEKHTSLVFCLGSLHNLANNGRVSPAVARIAGLLGIRAVGNVSEDGQITPTDKCRGEKKAIATAYGLMKKQGYAGGTLLIDHCYNENAANMLKNLTLAEFPDANVVIDKTGALCSFYAERGGLMIAFTTNDR